MRLQICAALMAMTLFAGCAETMAGGNSGCAAYGEARLDMPPIETARGDWLRWVAETDTRMTAVCR